MERAMPENKFFDLEFRCHGKNGNVFFIGMENARAIHIDDRYHSKKCDSTLALGDTLTAKMIWKNVVIVHVSLSIDIKTALH